MKELEYLYVITVQQDNAFNFEKNLRLILGNEWTNSHCFYNGFRFRFVSTETILLLLQLKCSHLMESIDKYPIHE